MSDTTLLAKRAHKGVFATLGASSHSLSEREENDFYATESIAIDALLEKATPNSRIWECACGNGALSKRLIELGYEVKSTDLIDRDYGIGGVDFLECHEVFDGDILTNPPYKAAQKFIEHALELIPTGCKVYMFLKLQFLESEARQSLFSRGELKAVYVFVKRICCAKGGDFAHAKRGSGSAIAYAWFEFEKGYNGQPTIDWINGGRNDE